MFEQSRSETLLLTTTTPLWGAEGRASMRVQRAYKTELDLTDRQVTACKQHAGAARWAYNWGLQVKHERYRATKKSPTATELHRELNALKKTEVPWMYQVSKCAPQEALWNLDAAFAHFFRRCALKKQGNGTVIPNPQHLKWRLKKLKRLQRVVSRRQKGGKNHRLAQAIGDVGFYEFKRQLLYKASWYGSRVILADRWEPSSKRCSGCGWIDADLTLADRTFHCEQCRLVLDRDLNAAINLEKLAGSFLGQSKRLWSRQRWQQSRGWCETVCETRATGPKEAGTERRLGLS